MKLEKLITNNKTTHEYQPFVDEFISIIVNNFSNKIHSIYLCGSIPKGEAVQYHSDADFTLVFNNDLSENDLRTIEKQKKSLLEKYAFIIKIDTPTVTVQDVLRNPYDWGFWIKIISICIYGEDLSNKLPEMLPSKDLIIGINSDTVENLRKLRSDLIQHNDPKQLFRTQQKLARRLIIALYTLILPKSQIWTDDIKKMKETIIKYDSKLLDIVEYLYFCTANIEINKDVLLSISEKAHEIFEKRIREL